LPNNDRVIEGRQVKGPTLQRLTPERFIDPRLSNRPHP
jgi:hypothetical protein